MNPFTPHKFTNIWPNCSYGVNKTCSSRNKLKNVWLVDQVLPFFNENTLSIAYDGSFSENLAGWGFIPYSGGKLGLSNYCNGVEVLFKNNCGPVISSPSDPNFIGAEKQSNNTAELSALCKSLEAALSILSNSNCTFTSVLFLSDSEYSLNAVLGINNSITNLDLIARSQKSLILLENLVVRGLNINIGFTKVKAHNHHKWNDLADSLACKGRLLNSPNLEAPRPIIPYSPPLLSKLNSYLVSLHNMEFDIFEVISMSQKGNISSASEIRFHTLEYCLENVIDLGDKNVSALEGHRNRVKLQTFLSTASDNSTLNILGCREMILSLCLVYNVNIIFWCLNSVMDNEITPIDLYDRSQTSTFAQIHLLYKPPEMGCGIEASISWIESYNYIDDLVQKMCVVNRVSEDRRFNGLRNFSRVPLLNMSNSFINMGDIDIDYNDFSSNNDSSFGVLEDHIESLSGPLSIGSSLCHTVDNSVVNSYQSISTFDDREDFYDKEDCVRVNPVICELEDGQISEHSLSEHIGPSEFLFPSNRRASLRSKVSTKKDVYIYPTKAPRKSVLSVSNLTSKNNISALDCENSSYTSILNLQLVEKYHYYSCSLDPVCNFVRMPICTFIHPSCSYLFQKVSIQILDLINFLFVNKLQFEYERLLQHCILAFYFIPTLSLNDKGKSKSASAFYRTLEEIIESDFFIKSILDMRDSYIHRFKPNVFKKHNNTNNISSLSSAQNTKIDDLVSHGRLQKSMEFIGSIFDNRSVEIVDNDGIVREEIKEAFELFDTDKDNALDYHELKVHPAILTIRSQ